MCIIMFSWFRIKAYVCFHTLCYDGMDMDMDKGYGVYMSFHFFPLYEGISFIVTSYEGKETSCSFVFDGYFPALISTTILSFEYMYMRF